MKIYLVIINGDYMIKAVFVNDNPKKIMEVFGDGQMNQVFELTDCLPEIITMKSFYKHAKNMRNIEVIFSTWGMPVFNKAMLAAMPNLRAVFYAAGSVKYFAENMLDRGIKISSTWCINAIPVAEFTTGQIILSCKRYFANTRSCSDPEKNSNVSVGLGAYNEIIALIGCGMIARNVIRILKEFSVRIVVADPYLTNAEALKLGVKKVSLEDAFSKAYVVSNHLPDITSTVGLLNGKLFKIMRHGATFINTGRGIQVIEEEMIKVLKTRSDLTALLDVSNPEPPQKDSELYKLKNVQLSSHIAGAMGNEVVRMADCAIDEFKLWRDNLPMRYEVTEDMLKTMA